MQHRETIRGIADLLLSTGLALLCGLLVEPWLGEGRVAVVSLAYLASVVFVAVRRGLALAFIATVIAAVCVNFFFLAPRYSLHVDDPTDILALMLFSLVAVVVANLGSRARAVAQASTERMELAQAINAFVQGLAQETRVDGLCQVAVQQLAAFLEADVAILLLPMATTLHIVPETRRLSPQEFEAARRLLRDRVPQRVADGELVAPIAVDGKIAAIAVIRALQGRGSPTPGSGSDTLRETLLDQVGAALKRIESASEVERMRRAAEFEKFRSLLVNSISHDLRSPLAVVRAAAETLKEAPDPVALTRRQELAQDIIVNTDYLAATLSDVLEMSKIEAGVVKARLKDCELGTLIERVVLIAEPLLAQHNLKLALPPPPLTVQVDPSLLERALLNLLDNAAKYSPRRSTIELCVAADTQGLEITVSDEGPGIDPMDAPRIFDKFFRSGSAASRRQGSGLGLAIAHGFIEALGGSLSVRPRLPAPGSSFVIALPQAKEMA